MYSVLIFSHISGRVLFLHRFLRARQFDLIKTKEMLLDAEKWRNDFGVDELVKFVLSLSPFLYDV